MAAAVVVAAAVLLAECAVHATASSPPPPTTYRPSWNTTAPAPPPTAAIHEAGQPTGGRQPLTLEQLPGPSRGRPVEAASSGAASRLERVVLRQEVYQGETRLVYRLAPGAIFAGVRTSRLPSPPDAGWQDTRGGGGAKLPKKYSGGQEDRLRKPVKPNRKQPGSLAAGWTATRPDMQSHKQPQPAPRSPPRRWAPLAGLRANLATLSTAGLGAVRGFRLIVMLMQYLGYLPHLPGFPKYEDPAHRRPSTKYTLNRGETVDL